MQVTWWPSNGQSRLCSVNYEQLSAFGTTLCDSSNSEKFLYFWPIFRRNVGLDNISSTKNVDDFIEISISANFFELLLTFGTNNLSLENVSFGKTPYESRVCSVSQMNILKFRPYLRPKFHTILLDWCWQLLRKKKRRKPFINVYIKISTVSRSNFEIWAATFGFLTILEQL